MTSASDFSLKHRTSDAQPSPVLEGGLLGMTPCWDVSPWKGVAVFFFPFSSYMKVCNLGFVNFFVNFIKNLSNVSYVCKEIYQI